MGRAVVRQITDSDYVYLNFCEQFFYTYMRLPTDGEGMAAGHNEGTIKRCIKSSVFNQMLASRGITQYTELDSDGCAPKQLSSEQLQAVTVMLDIRDNRSQKKKLNDLGLTTQKWETWLHDPAFQNYIRQRAENMLGGNLHEAHVALLQRVRAGELGAIKYLNEITGRYVPEKTKGVDVNSVILQVIEVIQIHVTDPATQSAIADDLLKIVHKVGALYNGEPVIAKQVRSVVARPMISNTVDIDPVEVLEKVELD